MSDSRNTKKGVYYNEIDPKAAAWLRELIKAGAIAPGEVDARSILDVTPADLKGFTQCHFFAGIGVWSYALRLAGWPDDREVWTGSCPCQPFSAAGKGGGFADERHLWPSWFHIIEQCRPPNIFGEQVASKNADAWIDLVHDDLEAVGYSFGAVPFPAAGIGAPHIRDRTYWLADASSARRAGAENRSADRNHAGEGRGCAQPERGSQVGRLGYPESNGPEVRKHIYGELPGQRLTEGRNAGGMANNIMQQRPDGQPGVGLEHDTRGRDESAAAPAGFCSDMRPSPTNSYWGVADWLACRDGKWRPVESGTFPLAHGAPARVGRLRGYGNAIVAEAAAEFVRAYQAI